MCGRSVKILLLLPANARIVDDEEGVLGRGLLPAKFHHFPQKLAAEGHHQLQKTNLLFSRVRLQIFDTRTFFTFMCLRENRIFFSNTFFSTPSRLSYISSLDIHSFLRARKCW